MAFDKFTWGSGHQCKIKSSACTVDPTDPRKLSRWEKGSGHLCRVIPCETCCREKTFQTAPNCPQPPNSFSLYCLEAFTFDESTGDFLCTVSFGRINENTVYNFDYCALVATVDTPYGGGCSRSRIFTPSGSQNPDVGSMQFMEDPSQLEISGQYWIGALPGLSTDPPASVTLEGKTNFPELQPVYNCCSFSLTVSWLSQLGTGLEVARVQYDDVECPPD